MSVHGYLTQTHTHADWLCTQLAATTCCMDVQALPLADFRSEHVVTAVAFLPGHGSCMVGYADGRLALLDLAPAAAAADTADEEPGSSQHSAGSLGAIRWSVARHASPVVSLALHPCQPLVMAASR